MNENVNKTYIKVYTARLMKLFQKIKTLLYQYDFYTFMQK